LDVSEGGKVKKTKRGEREDTNCSLQIEGRRNYDIYSPHIEMAAPL